MSHYNSPSQTPSQDDVMEVQQGLSQISLADDAPTWSDDETKAAQFESLRNVALGNCRLLYGSERMKFYDIILGTEEDESAFCAALICSKEGTSKVLRATMSNCPIKAIRALTTRLQKDSMPLLVKGGLGSMMTGQQGCTQANGQWKWTEKDRIERCNSPVDNTGTLPRQMGRGDFHRPPPRGPRSHLPARKRPCPEKDEAGERSPSGSLDYGGPANDGC